MPYTESDLQSMGSVLHTFGADHGRDPRCHNPTEAGSDTALLFRGNCLRTVFDSWLLFYYTCLLTHVLFAASCFSDHLCPLQHTQPTAVSLSGTEQLLISAMCTCFASAALKGLSGRLAEALFFMCFCGQLFCCFWLSKLCTITSCRSADACHQRNYLY